MTASTEAETEASTPPTSTQPLNNKVEEEEDNNKNNKNNNTTNEHELKTANHVYILDPEHLTSRILAQVFPAA
jgi:hypothetical protein